VHASGYRSNKCIKSTLEIPSTNRFNNYFAAINFISMISIQQLYIFIQLFQIDNKELFQCKVLLMKDKTDNHTISMKELRTVDEIHTDSKEEVVKT
jgi:hypothetical protein